MGTKLYYCEACKRVSECLGKCPICSAETVKILKGGTSVNVIGSKVKGRYLRTKGEAVELIVINEAKEKIIKEYKPAQLKKII